MDCYTILTQYLLFQKEYVIHMSDDRCYKKIKRNADDGTVIKEKYSTPDLIVKSMSGRFMMMIQKYSSRSEGMLGSQDEDIRETDTDFHGKYLMRSHL